MVVTGPVLDGAVLSIILAFGTLLVLTRDGGQRRERSRRAHNLEVVHRDARREEGVLNGASRDRDDVRAVRERALVKAEERQLLHHALELRQHVGAIGWLWKSDFCGAA